MATFNVILDTRRLKEKTGTYPIKLRVVHKSVSKDFQTIFHLSAEDYSKLSSFRISRELGVIKEHIREIRRTAENAIASMRHFSMLEFEKKYVAGNPLFRERKILQENIETAIESTEIDLAKYLGRFPIFEEACADPRQISSAFTIYIKRLISEDRIGSALNLQSSYFSLKMFNGNIPLSQATPGYLVQYEKWMLKRGRSLATVGINARNLRTIYNEAIANGLAFRDEYPFGKRKYIIPRSSNVKKAIGIDEIGKLYYYQPVDPGEQRAKDFWLFCYFANGMNPKDLAHLKFRNLNGDFFTFYRAKTLLATRANPKPITVFINDEMKTIIDKYANSETNPDNFVFPVLQQSMSPVEQHYAVRTFVRFINDRMKRMGKQLGIPIKLTTLVSRHSFSTQLKRSGASTEFIQEALGHVDKATTENYLDSFGDEVKKKFAKSLVAFKR